MEMTKKFYVTFSLFFFFSITTQPSCISQIFLSPFLRFLFILFIGAPKYSHELILLQFCMMQKTECVDEHDEQIENFYFPLTAPRKIYKKIFFRSFLLFSEIRRQKFIETFLFLYEKCYPVSFKPNSTKAISYCYPFFPRHTPLLATYEKFAFVLRTFSLTLFALKKASPSLTSDESRILVFFMFLMF